MSLCFVLKNWDEFLHILIFISFFTEYFLKCKHYLYVNLPAMYLWSVRPSYLPVHTSTSNVHTTAVLCVTTSGPQYSGLLCRLSLQIDLAVSSFRPILARFPWRIIRKSPFGIHFQSIPKTYFSGIYFLRGSCSQTS